MRKLIVNYKAIRRDPDLHGVASKSKCTIVIIILYTIVIAYYCKSIIILIIVIIIIMQSDLASL